MIKRRQCPHCRAPFHARLYMQFGLKDYMPKHWVYRPWDILFTLGSYDGQNIEWDWKYNRAKLELWKDQVAGAWTRDPSMIVEAADLLYPNKPPNYGMKQFFYQTLGYYYDKAQSQIVRGRNPTPYNYAGELATTNADLVADGGDLPGRHEQSELLLEENYQGHRLHMQAMDALLHKISPETLRWLKGGPDVPRPRRITQPADHRAGEASSSRAGSIQSNPVDLDEIDGLDED